MKKFRIGKSYLVMKPGTIIFTDGMLPENLKCLASASDLVCGKDYLFADNQKDAEKLIAEHGKDMCYLFEFDRAFMKANAYYSEYAYLLLYENGVYYLHKQDDFILAMH